MRGCCASSAARHSGDEARRAVELALAAGFDWVSLDLIYGAPRRRRGIRSRSRSPTSTAAIALAPAPCLVLPAHRPRRNAVRRGARSRPPARARRRRSGDASSSRCTRRWRAGGYPAYEVSNFARGAEHRSRHNTKYWRHVPYLGLGPSAHSFDGAGRWWNLRDWREWAAAVEGGSPRARRRRGADRGDELALEALLLGLRTADGIDLDRYRDRYGVDLLAAQRERDRARAAAKVCSSSSRSRGFDPPRAAWRSPTRWPRRSISATRERPMEKEKRRR